MAGASFELSWIDYAIVAVYFLGVIGHGLYVSRKLDGGSESYFLAGRSLPGISSAFRCLRQTCPAPALSV